MTFDLTALKAYVGGVVAAGGAAVGGFLIGGFEAATSIDIPVGLETYFIGGVSFVLGYIAVYITQNKPA